MTRIRGSRVRRHDRAPGKVFRHKVDRRLRDSRATGRKISYPTAAKEVRLRHRRKLRASRGRRYRFGGDFVPLEVELGFVRDLIWLAKTTIPFNFSEGRLEAGFSFDMRLPLSRLLSYTGVLQGVKHLLPLPSTARAWEVECGLYDEAVFDKDRPPQRISFTIFDEPWFGSRPKPVKKAKRTYVSRSKIKLGMVRKAIRSGCDHPYLMVTRPLHGETISEKVEYSRTLSYHHFESQISYDRGGPSQPLVTQEEPGGFPVGLCPVTGMKVVSPKILSGVEFGFDPSCVTFACTTCQTLGIAQGRGVVMPEFRKTKVTDLFDMARIDALTRGKQKSYVP